MTESDWAKVAAKVKAKLAFECDCSIKEKTGKLYVVAYFEHKDKMAYSAASVSDEVMNAIGKDDQESDGIAGFFAKAIAGKREDFIRDNP
jgi:hypothetical protein